MQFPNSVVSAVVACKNGVKRTHIVDARIDGGLLLELYSRDGVGSMISTDFYEGIRGARTSDLDNILVRTCQLPGIGHQNSTSTSRWGRLGESLRVLYRVGGLHWGGLLVRTVLPGLADSSDKSSHAESAT